MLYTCASIFLKGQLSRARRPSRPACQGKNPPHSGHFLAKRPLMTRPLPSHSWHRRWISCTEQCYMLHSPASSILESWPTTAILRYHDFEWRCVTQMATPRPECHFGKERQPTMRFANSQEPMTKGMVATMAPNHICGPTWTGPNFGTASLASAPRQHAAAQSISSHSTFMHPCHPQGSNVC